MLNKKKNNKNKILKDVEARSSRLKKGGKTYSSFEVFIGHNAIGFNGAGFFLSQGLGLAIEKASQVVIVVQLVVTRWRFGARLIVVRRNVTQNGGVTRSHRIGLGCFGASHFF